MLPVETLRELKAMALPALVEIDGRQYATTTLRPVEDPTPTPLKVHTLSGLLDFVRTNRDGLKLSQCVVHVVGPTEVRLHSKVEGGWLQRHTHAISAFESAPRFAFGAFMPQDEFVVRLQTAFVQDAITKQVLKIVGTTKDQKVITAEDDGLTQQVTASAGIARVQQMAVPNPVQLCPYRTFTELDQPPSTFVLRMRSGSRMPEVALFDLDDKRWVLDAIHSIQDLLVAGLPNDVAVIA